MVAVPGAVTPVTTPVEPTTVALPLLLVHVPVGSASERVVVAFLQTDSVPLMAGSTDGSTLTVIVVLQPPGSI